MMGTTFRNNKYMVMDMKWWELKDCKPAPDFGLASISIPKSLLLSYKYWP
jgi:hypothetical protein